MKTLILAMVLLGSAIVASAQTQVIAETTGKGKVAAFVSENAITIKDFTTASFSTAQVWYGLSDRFDAFVGASETILLGQKQTAAMIGGNVNLLKSKTLSVSTFNTLSVPLNRRVDACGTTWFTALVVSKNITTRRLALTPYGGYSVTVPLGQTDGKLFTPAEPMHNVPVGIAIPKGKFMFFAEYNFGKKQQIGGFGVAYTF